MIARGLAIETVLTIINFGTHTKVRAATGDCNFVSIWAEATCLSSDTAC